MLGFSPDLKTCALLNRSFNRFTSEWIEKSSDTCQFHHAKTCFVVTLLHVCNSIKTYSVSFTSLMPPSIHLSMLYSKPYGLESITSNASNGNRWESLCFACRNCVRACLYANRNRTLFEHLHNLFFFFSFLTFRFYLPFPRLFWCSDLNLPMLSKHARTRSFLFEHNL